MGERLGALVYCLEEVLTVLFKNRPSFAFWRVLFFRRLVSVFFKKNRARAKSWPILATWRRLVETTETFGGPLVGHFAN